jgi:hypothetical protein
MATTGDTDTTAAGDVKREAWDQFCRTGSPADFLAWSNAMHDEQAYQAQRTPEMEAAG